MNTLWTVASVLFILNSALSVPSNNGDGGMTVVHKWKTLDFDYANTKARNDALKKGEYIPKNNIPLDGDYHPPTDRFFVAMPPFRNGTPASLGEVLRGSSNVKPFPKWPNFNDKNICSKGAPFSVYRIFIDRCGLMWVPDAGINESLTGTKVNCPPKLLVYDLNNNKDQELLRYEFPKGVITDRSLLVNVLTESYKSDCSDTMAYVADIMDYALIVFDYAQKTSWRISHKYFRMFPTAPTMTMTNGIALDLNDGLCGLALSPITDKERKLYFHSFSSLHESWVPVNVIKNSTLVKDDLVLRHAFSISPGMRTGHSTVQVMTIDGILIYPVLPNNTLFCWNYRTPFTKENQHVVKKDDEKFQFISGMKLIGNRLLITSSRFHTYLLMNLSDTDYNFRLVMIDDVRQLLRNTPCAAPALYANDFFNGSANTGVSCYGANCEKSTTSSPIGVREPSYSGSNNYNSGTSSCSGSVCEKPSSSSASGREPSNSGVIFKPHSWSASYGGKKPSGYDITQNRLGSADADVNATEKVIVAPQNNTESSKKVSSSGKSTSKAKSS